MNIEQNAYGSTELSPAATMSLEDDDFALRTSTIGCSLPHVEIKVIDPESLKIMPVGQKGEILVRGYLTMLGYYDEPAKTDEVWDSASIFVILFHPTYIKLD